MARCWDTHSAINEGDGYFALSCAQVKTRFFMEKIQYVAQTAFSEIFSDRICLDPIPSFFYLPSFVQETYKIGSEVFIL